jgi:hypothetical protein
VYQRSVLAEYVSPEVLGDEEAHGASDLWALGCTLFQMAAGRPPFRGPTEFAVLQEIGEYTSGRKALEWPEGVPDAVRDLTHRLMRKAPERRLGAQGLVGVPVIEDEDVGGYSLLKAHPFFEGVDWESVGTSRASAPWLPKCRVLPEPTSPSPLSWEALGEDFVESSRGEGDAVSRSSSVVMHSGTTPIHPMAPREPAPTRPAGQAGWVTHQSSSDGESDGEAELTASEVTVGMARVLPGEALPSRLYRGQYWASLIPDTATVVMFGRVGKKRGWFSRVRERDIVLLLHPPGSTRTPTSRRNTQPPAGTPDVSSRSRLSSLPPLPRPAIPTAEIVYFDPSTKALRGDIAWDDDMAVASTDLVRWTLTCRSGSYQLWDYAERAERWVSCLTTVLKSRLSVRSRLLDVHSHDTNDDEEPIGGALLATTAASDSSRD